MLLKLMLVEGEGDCGVRIKGPCKLLVNLYIRLW